MNKWQKFISEKEMPINFIRFYAVGLLLFALPFTRDFFVTITSLTLLLVIVAIFMFHKDWNLKTIILFIFISISSFWLEMEGVKTGKIFGNYEYDNGLGIKLGETPLIIGLNWLFLVYATQSIAAEITKNKIIRIILGALLMIMFDIVVEFVAPAMQMWHFSTFYPPVINFTTWFVAALVFHSGMVLLNINVENRPARMLFWIQTGFFILIAIYRFLFMI